MVHLQDARAVSSEGGDKGSGALGHGKGSRKASLWRCPGWAPKRARAETQPGQKRGAQSQCCSTPARVPSAWRDRRTAPSLSPGRYLCCPESRAGGGGQPPGVTVCVLPGALVSWRCSESRASCICMWRGEQMVGAVTLEIKDSKSTFNLDLIRQLRYGN